MAIISSKNNIDSMVTYILIKKIVTPINSSDAYKLGLVDVTGRTIREPTSLADNNALTVLDKFAFKLKRLLGAKIINLNKFLYVQTMNNNYYKDLIARGTIDSRAEIKRMQADVANISEKYNINVEDLISYVIGEDIREELED